MIMNQEQKPITFGKIMKVAFGGWKLLLCVAVGVTLVGTLGIHFGYNRLKTKYVSVFTYNKADLNNGFYADGSDFYYSEIAFESNFKNVADSDEKFASINVSKMFEKGDVRLSKELVDEFPVYTLSVSGKYFSSEAQAREFFEGVVNYPVERDEELLDKTHYEKNLISFDSANTYEEQITYLIGHANTIRDSYKRMEESEKEELSVSSLAYIGNNKAELDSIVGTDNVNLSDLFLIVSKNGFVKDYESSEFVNIEATRDALVSEKANNLARISNLQAALSGVSVTLTNIDKEILALSERNAAIDVELAGIDEKIAHKDDHTAAYLAKKEVFESTLSSYREKLSQCTSSYVNVLRQSYTSTASVGFENSGVIESKGSISLPLAIVLSALAGVVAGGVVNLIVRRKMFQE